MWAKKGLQLRVENNEVDEALKSWYKSTIDTEVGEEREAEKTMSFIELLQSDRHETPLVPTTMPVLDRMFQKWLRAQ